MFPPGRDPGKGRLARVPALGMALPLLLAGCLGEIPNLTQSDNPSDPRVRLSTPIVWIADPGEGGVIQRSELYSETGAPVFFGGEFTPGRELHLMAVREDSPNVGFFIVRIPITDTVSPGPGYIQSSPAILVNTYRIRLRLRLRDADGGVVSVDSVNVNLR